MQSEQKSATHYDLMNLTDLSASNQNVSQVLHNNTTLGGTFDITQVQPSTQEDLFSEKEMKTVTIQKF